MKLQVVFLFWAAVSASSLKHGTPAELLKKSVQKVLSRYVQLDGNRFRINLQDIFTLDCSTEPDTPIPGNILPNTKTRCRGSMFLNNDENPTLQFEGTTRVAYKPQTSDEPSKFLLYANGRLHDKSLYETTWYRYRAHGGHRFVVDNGQLSVFPEFDLESALIASSVNWVQNDMQEPIKYTFQHNMTIELDASTLTSRDMHASELRISPRSSFEHRSGEKWSDSANITAGLQATHDCERGFFADDCNIKMLVDYDSRLEESAFYPNNSMVYSDEHATHHSGKIDLHIGDTIIIRSNIEIDTPEFYLQVANLIKPAVQAQLMNAVHQYLAPFETYGRAALSSSDSLAHAVVWVDRRLSEFTDEFDCSRLFAATQIDGGGMGCLWNSTACITSVQEFVQVRCETVNYEIVEWIGSTAIPFIRRTREYVNLLTSASVGGEFYWAWASENGF